MGSGYSIAYRNVDISKQRMKQIYAKYSDQSAYDLWKKQLEEAARKQQYYETKPAQYNIIRKPESV
uniref:Uncharacterized protein n=1 Tax=viral metagenome TaxID=1070528 RepID=A0A6C0JZQ9_9ZZZZ